MNSVEIILMIVFTGFVFIIASRLFGAKLKNIFKKSQKEKKTKQKEKLKKPKKEKVDKKQKSQIVQGKTEKVFGKDKDKGEKQSSEEVKDEKQVIKNDEKDPAFKITKKGVAKISKKALERDSRSLAKVEQAITREEMSKYSSFDDMLEKMKSVGDPDELDDETFRNMFMGGRLKPSEKSDMDDEYVMSSNFISSETREGESPDRKLKHFTVSGNHLRINNNFDNFPNRKPMLPDHIDFTQRITGRYSNITMGDVSNRLAPPTDSDGNKNMNDEFKEIEESDEDIFAKIMERRRREMGIAPISENNSSNSDDMNSDIDMKTLVIADAIMNPAYKKHKKK